MLNREPFDEFSDTAFPIELLEGGGLPVKRSSFAFPDSNHLWTLMTSCWRDVGNRPNATELLALVEALPVGS